MHEVILIEVGCNRPELNEPIGICTIAAFLTEKNGLDEVLIKLFWQRLSSRRVAPIHLRNAVLVGISAQINSLEQTRELYALVRQARPDVPIVIGNLLAIYAGEQLLTEFPDVIICSGEGEAAFAELHRLVAEESVGTLDRRRLKIVPGLLYIDEGELVRTGTRLLNAGEIPVPRREFTADLVSAGGIVRVEGSRGCHWGRCEFCSVGSRFGVGGYRRFPPARIVADLEIIAAAGSRSPYFSDEDFFGGRYEESQALAHSVIGAKKQGRIPADMNFFVSVLASDVKHPQGRAALLDWRKAGVREVFVGIEAGAEHEIRRFAKKANAGTNTTALKSLLAMGFQVDIGFIMFDPMMTFDDLSENVEWLQRQTLEDVDSRVTKRLRIQPRTGLEEKYKALITGPMDVDELTYPSSFVDPRVGRVEEQFREWEAELKSEVYSLLGKARGEVRSEELRMSGKRRLAAVRSVDVSYLRALIDFERGTKSAGELDKLRRQLVVCKRNLLGSPVSSLQELRC